jgi:glucokinase
MSPTSHHQTPLYVGLDIGGTKLLVASADAEGRILERVQEPTPLDLEAGLDALHRMIAAVTHGQPVTAIGAAVGGPLDWERGVVSPLHQPQWREVALRAIMEARWSCPLYVDVDTNVAALGEYHFGGERAPRLLYLTLSTGMGGGFLIDGRVYRGMDGGHPEAAHQAVNFRCRNPGAVACECGAPDCLEALVSGNAIRRIYGKPAEALDKDEWDEVAYNLGQGLRNLAALYLPDVVILGGGVAVGGGARLLAPAVATMERHLHIVAPPAVRLSRLGYETALMGTIAIAIHGLA